MPQSSGNDVRIKKKTAAGAEVRRDFGREKVARFPRLPVTQEGFGKGQEEEEEDGTG